ncbi:hypothetical protein V6N12_057984 [Hibiscus sabdariffa]|uniref:Uncharacterized protein n=1 Tax=Hibiscus sabdariffa TaxID=183260 RepID=A0ABR1ZAE8_9ROSI
MRISGDRVLLIFDDVGVRTRILASDSLSKWFDRVAELNEEDCAMGCWRLCISIFGVPDAQDSSTDSEQMENHPQDAPVEQEAHVDAVRQFDKDKEVVEGEELILKAGMRITDSAPSPLSFVEKLRSLKAFLKVWNRESFGSVDLQFETTTELLNDLEEGGTGDGSLEEFEASTRQLQGTFASSIRQKSLGVCIIRFGDCKLMAGGLLRQGF